MKIDHVLSVNDTPCIFARPGYTPFMRPLDLVLALLLLAPAGAASAKEDLSAYALHEELKLSTSTHEWAGIYHGFGGIDVAADGRYCTSSSSCFGTGYGPCGRLRPDGDRLVEAGWNPWKKRAHHGPPYLRIPWGERRYLVPEDEILDFINDVNSSHEPRTGHGGASSAYLRGGEIEILVTGQPLVPEKYRAMLLPKPLMTTAVEISTRTNIITRYGDYEDEDCGAEARFDAGASSGVFVGMKLHAQAGDPQVDAVIREVSERSSSGRIKQSDCDKTDPLPRGSRFSSRPSWRMNSTLSTEPLTTEILFASTKRYPPMFDGDPQEFFFGDPFAGAAAEGFTVEKVADATFRGPFLGALSLQAVKDRMERAILSIGGNAIVQDRRFKQEHDDEAAGGIETRRLQVFRISYRGKPIEPGSRFYVHAAAHRRGEPPREDWKRAALSARAVLCGLPEAGRAAGLALLRWDEKTLGRAHELRKRIFHREYDAGVEYKRAHPAAAAECERLREEESRRD